MNEELTSTISRLIIGAVDNEANDTVRSNLLDRYMGELYGNEKKQGYSKFVSTDVTDAVEAQFCEIMDVFTSAENIVQFNPVGPEDEEAAAQETDAVSNIFWQQNDGFMVLSTWIKECLIQQVAYVYRGWEEKTRVTLEEYDDLSPDEFMQIVQQIEQQGYDDFEVLEKEGIGEGGAPTGPIRFKVRLTRTDKKYRVFPIPQEDFFITDGWSQLSLDGVLCCGHKAEREVGELREMGFSEESIAKAGFEDGLTDDQAYSRVSTRDHWEQDLNREEGDEASRKVTLYEAYVRADYNGDGKAELLRVYAANGGRVVLDWESGEPAIDEVVSAPYSALTPYIVPHRHAGRSTAEQVDDIAEVKTALWRNTLDSIYRNVQPKAEYDETLAGPNLLADLQNPEGVAVRTGGAMINWQQPPQVAPHTLPLIDKLDDVKESRIGATRYNQGMDGESLNKTATGIGKIMAAAEKRTKLIARTFAETGIRDLFLGIHADLRRGPMKELVLKLRGQWAPINPRTWRERTDMTVSVGMGSGDREQRRQGLSLMSQVQREILTAGGMGGMVTPVNVYATAEKMMETFGYDSIAPFMNDPRQMEPQQPQPDPAQEMAQMQAQMMQAQMQIEQTKLQVDQAKIALDQQKEANRAAEKARELELKAQGLVMDDDYKRDKMQADAATGFMRDNAAQVASEPPLPYQQVLR